MLFPLCEWPTSCPPCPHSLSQICWILFLSCQNPIQVALPSPLADSLLCSSSPRPDAQLQCSSSHPALLWGSVLIFSDKSGASWRQGQCPIPTAPDSPTPGSVSSTCYLVIAQLLILTPSRKEKHLKNWDHVHTEGGNSVFSLKRQEVMVGEGTGRTENQCAGKHQGS